MHQPFDHDEAGKKLAAIAHEDGCTVEEACQRCMDLYRAIQMGVWKKGYMLGVIDADGIIYGIVAGKATPRIDPNFEIDLD